MKNEELYALKDVVVSLSISLKNHKLGSVENEKSAVKVIAKALQKLEDSI